MLRIFSTGLDAAIAALILLPLFLLFNRFWFHDLRKTVCCFFFCVFLCAMFAVAGLPDIRYMRFDPRFNFKPFAYMFSDYTNSLLNVLLFVPLGFSLPVLWRKYASAGKTLLFGFSVSLLIEVLQIFTYRASDVNDLMTNTLGTLIGWAAGKLVLQLVPGLVPSPNARELSFVCTAAFCVMFFLQPFLADWVCNLL